MELQCDCGNVRLFAPEPAQVTCCNCGICRRYMALWGYFRPDEVEIVTGAAGRASHQRGDREIEFLRCAACGCVTHYQTLAGDPDPIVAVNFRLAETLPHGVTTRYADNATR